MEIFPYRWRQAWNDWDLRSFILMSLTLQMILIFSGSHRNHVVSRWITFILWSAYLLADWVATFALGIFSNNHTGSDCASSSHSTLNEDRLAFWSPFLLLHLGGPDTITAFSLEDNELWMRHLMGLVLLCWPSQIGPSQPRISSFVSATNSFLRPPNMPRWSHSMAQYNLISFCLKDHPSPCNRFLRFLTVKERHIFRDLKNKSISEEESKDSKRFSACSGEWALEQQKHMKKFGWNVKVEFDQSILLWHTATDLCY